jgi:chorismate mutase / prephenate dehydrogenase
MSDEPAPPAAPVLASMRASIDAVDHALVELLARRRGLVVETFEHKQRLGLPLLDLGREAQLLAERAAFGWERGVPPDLVTRVMQAILHASHQDAENLARGGPPG